MGAVLTETVNVVKGSATIEGVLLKCDNGEFPATKERAAMAWHSIQLEHAGLPVKVPSSREVYLQLKDHVAMPVRIVCNVKAGIDKTSRDGKGAGALRLLYEAVRGEVLAHDSANEGLELPGAEKKAKKAGW